MDMGDWDVISLVTVPFVNAAIQAQSSSPTQMQVSTDTMAVQAGFGLWQITIGGSPDSLIFDIPLTDIQGTVKRAGLEPFLYPSLTATVRLVLTFVDTGSNSKKLVIDNTKPPTSIDSLVDGNNQPLSNTIDDAFIKSALTTWFDSNLSDFGHVFADIDLVPNIGSDVQWAFCKPSIIEHTYVAGSTLANSYLGLMYNTFGSTTPGSVAQIDPSFVPLGSQAAFMISPKMFFAEFVVPAACQQFMIASQQLPIDLNPLQATLAGGVQVPLPKTSANNSTYQPYLTNFQIAVENSIITTYAETSVLVLDAWYGTITAFNVSQSWVTLGLDGSGQSLIYTNTQPSINNHHLEQSGVFKILQGVLETIGIITLAVATVLTDGAALLVFGALVGVAQGGFQWALNWFESKNLDDAPEINELASNISLPVTWSSSGPFAVAQAGLFQGAFFLAGTLRSTS